MDADAVDVHIDRLEALEHGSCIPVEDIKMCPFSARTV